METEGSDTQIVMRQESMETNNTCDFNIDIVEINNEIVINEANCIKDDPIITKGTYKLTVIIY